jgi:transposase
MPDNLTYPWIFLVFLGILASDVRLIDGWSFHRFLRIMRGTDVADADRFCARPGVAAGGCRRQSPGLVPGSRWQPRGVCRSDGVLLLSAGRSYVHRFCAVQLVEAGIAKVREVCNAFDLHPRTFSRWRTSLRQQGIAGLVAEKVGRKPKSNPSLAAGIVQCYRQGLSTRKIGTLLGISPSTVQRILRDEDVQLRSPFDYHRFLPLADDDRVGSLVGPEITEPQAAESQAAESQAAESQSRRIASRRIASRRTASRRTAGRRTADRRTAGRRPGDH